MDDELYFQLVIMNSYLNAIVTRLCGAEVNKECLKTANDLAETKCKQIFDSLNEKEYAPQESEDKT